MIDDLDRDQARDDETHGQLREDPNPELVHQHDEERDPLDVAIEEEDGAIADETSDDAKQDELVDVVIERIRADREEAAGH
jgi:hypothetical protein